ncbi:GNAT family N-acetyltransferase [Natronobacterium gregoryi]|uniref:GNAT family histone acetyltransferase n=2 Tax=Natronobacterium gregoryi TaxID=44930 RepID=L0AM03_NATGS|nr:N-acetyltransferase [Natronobacterium gregoryi]AFZ74826.1 sortase-like acyltransferase [Natronobacterium gregoryi SP2]ELY66159.1 GNAT family histone acetyltransferase [Natronobacterium gregoryi SP2]PLK19468.1 N-acetyltransferase [Natronobacterium gregoryi SP2]SFJ43832.1 L-amino acid N-acyltransferase YncA [Natronobacterium gregoryi]
MRVPERPTFDDDATKAIYQYVERHGTAARHRVRDAASVPVGHFEDALEDLKTKGYLEEDGGTITVALDVGSIEEYEAEGETFTIRPARQDDFESVVEAIRDVTDDETYVVAETVAEQLLYDESVSRHNTVESRVFFVATLDGGVVGWTHLDLPHGEKLRETAQLTVGVREKYRNRGLGSRLLTRGVEWADANGYRKLYNSVPASNDVALAFLEDHGWHTEGIRKNHYTIDGEHVDEVLMARTF